mgnify:CR=1 FL=1
MVVKSLLVIFFSRSPANSASSSSRLLSAISSKHSILYIDYYELSTPLTTKNFTNYQKGELYGIDHSPSRFRQEFLRPRTQIKGMYLTGQDIVTAGVGGAMFSGVITASAMTGKNYMKRVMRK